jgi:hypothetical protein
MLDSPLRGRTMAIPLRRAVLVFLLAIGASPLAAQVPEYEAKSEFLERFTRFIDWPAEPDTPPTSPFVIGVVGRDPFGRYLDALASSRTIKGRPVQVRRLSGHAEVGACCQLLFIAGSEAPQLAQIVGRTAGKPVLTVGDTPGFAEKGVLINLYEDRGRIGFEVNEAGVRRSGLRFNSKLLRLARLVGKVDP